MKYHRNIENEFTFGELSRYYYYANLLVDNIMSENINEVRHLLESKKADPNTLLPELGVAPLHLLAGLENEDFSSTVTLQAILRNGGDSNVRSEDGLTPVHVAAMWGRCKVLEILLANGGDPELIDYKLFLNAEEYAIREQQWKAYGVLSTISVMAEEENKMDRFLDDTSHGNEINSWLSKLPTTEIKANHLPKLKQKVSGYSDENSSSKGSEEKYMYSTVNKDRNDQTHAESGNDQSNGLKYDVNLLRLNAHGLSVIKRQRRKTNIYESIGSIPDHSHTKNKLISKTSKEKSNKLSLYGDAVSESCDWIRKSVNSIKLDKKALNTIRNQRLNSKIYQTKGLGEDSQYDSKKPPLYEESEVCDWVSERKPETFDEPSRRKIKIHRTMAATYESKDADNLVMCSSSGPKLPKRNRKTYHKKKENSNMYLYGYAEESIRHNTRRQRSEISSHLSDVNSSDLDVEGIPNQRMLCKMSRIFLFMLKKRHIYQKIK